MPKKKPTHSTRLVEIGEEEWMNTETGEIETMPKLGIVQGDINFEKTWIWHLCDAYGLIGNKSIKVLNYLFENRNQENLIIATQRLLADKLELSLSTVTRSLKVLKKKDIISMPQQGVYRINPNVMWKGNHNTRMRVLYEYRDEKKAEKQEPPTKEQRKKWLTNQVNTYKQQMDKLLREIENLDSEELPVNAAAAE